MLRAILIRCLLICLTMLFNVKSMSDTDLEKLKQGFDEKRLLAEQFQKGNINLTLDIESEFTQCNETLTKLKNIKHSLFMKAVGKNKTIGGIMLRIEQEDLAHEKLEYELKSIYAKLNLYGVTYGIAYQTLVSLQEKRQVGADLRCQSVVKQHKDPELSPTVTPETDVIGARSLNKGKINNLKGIVLKNKIKVARIQENELKSKQEALLMERENNKQFCVLKESDLKEQISFTENVLKYSENTINILKADFQASITLTESLSIEIQFGKKLLETMSQNTKEFKKIRGFFKEDEECYAAVHKLEL